MKQLIKTIATLALLSSVAFAQDKTYEQLKREYAVKDSIKKAKEHDEYLDLSVNYAKKWFGDSTAISKEEARKFSFKLNLLLSLYINEMLECSGDRKAVVGAVFFGQYSDFRLKYRGCVRDFDYFSRTEYRRIYTDNVECAIELADKLTQAEREMLVTGKFNHEYFK